MGQISRGRSWSSRHEDRGQTKSFQRERGSKIPREGSLLRCGEGIGDGCENSATDKGEVSVGKVERT